MQTEKIRYRMTPFQKNIWQRTVSMPGTSIGANGGFFFSSSMTDFALWEQIMVQILEIYPMFRLQFDGQESFALTQQPDYTLPRVDRRGCTHDEIEQEMADWMRQPLEERQCALFDFRYIQADDGVYLYGRFSHLLMDGISIMLLLKQQEKLYLERAEGRKMPHPVDSSFLQQMSQPVAGYENQTALEWYRAQWNHTNSEADFFELMPDGRADHVFLNLPEELDSAIRIYTAAHNCSAEVIAFGATALLMSRYTGQTALAVGRSVANRTPKQLRQMGMYVNTQAVLCRPNQQTAAEYLIRIQENLLHQLRWMDYPFDQWKQDMGLTGRVFETSISYRNTRLLPRMKQARIGELYNGYSELPLRLNWNQGKNSTQLELQFSVQGWDREQAKAFLKRICWIAKQMVETPEMSLDEISIFSNEDLEVQKKTIGSSGPERDTILPRCIASLWERREETVIQGERRLTGAQILSLAAFFASYLKKQGIGMEQAVGIATGKSEYLPVWMLATLIAGGCFLPIALQEAPERKEGLGRFCRYVVTPEVQRQVLEKYTQSSHFSQESLQYLEQTIPGISPDQTAYLISTSGTTGTPKIACISHDSLYCRLAWMTGLIGEGGEYLQKTRVSFDVSIWELLLPLMDGGVLHILPDGKESNLAFVAQQMIQRKISKVHFVPSALSVLLEYARIHHLVFPDLKYLICSGEALQANQVDRALACMPQAKVYNLYGPAECSIDVCAHLCSTGEQAVPIGQAAWSTQLWIMNSKQQPLPWGVEGELCIAGRLVGKGYLAESADRKAQNRFFLWNGMPAYLTGDRAYFDQQGQFFFRGRWDDILKIRGMKVVPSDVERAAETISGVDQAVVFGQENRLILAYCGPQTLPEQQIRLSLQQLLPYYSLPDRIFFLPEIPMGAHGKRDVKAIFRLLKQTIQPVSKVSAPIPAEYQGVFDIVRRRLPQLVSAEQSLLDLGLTSLDVVELTLDLQQAGYSVQYEDIYLGDNIRGICNRLQMPANESSDVIVLGKDRVPRNIIVCFPYAGGSVECFAKINEAFRESDTQIWVSSLEKVKKCEYNINSCNIINLLPRDCHIWVMGYCVGMSAALAMVDELEKQGRPPRGLWLCAAYPYRAFSIGKQWHTLWDFLPDVLAVKLLSWLYGKKISFRGKYDLFKEEVRQAQVFLREQCFPRSVKTTVFYGDKDPVTFGYPRRAKALNQYLSNIDRVIPLPGQGHYFMEEKGEEIGRMIKKAIDAEDRECSHII